ncbi:alpha/beta hydrolase [Yoonia sp.]|uniref:RBBP9/YdeN family alpha/beta hydrolase n=1 Tax=Yoonia sp. TaxID=2212373 RepID=UPI0019E3E98B|nr:alpha/beta hydrolase [Yoonia sp.]MBE0412148.1 serine hydrolase family protein [Yoonia sp.]
MTRTLLIPGIDGSPDPHWQAWWQKNDPMALTVDQDDWSNPSPEAWEAEVAGAVLQHPGAILVAHSLGCLVVARLLAIWPHLNIAGALLVAPVDPARCDRLRRFMHTPRTELPVPVTVVASRNDPLLPFEDACDLAHDWGAALVDMGRAGHINIASGFGPWSQGLELRDALARHSRAYVMPRSRKCVSAERWAF